jgi:RHS repeat-associated protein
MAPSAILSTGYTSTVREWDKETGLYYYRARYYDPMEGRFISKDQISFNGGDFNLHGYAKNNPVNYTDPSG